MDRDRRCDRLCRGIMVRISWTRHVDRPWSGNQVGRGLGPCRCWCWFWIIRFVTLRTCGFSHIARTFFGPSPGLRIPVGSYKTGAETSSTSSTRTPTAAARQPARIAWRTLFVGRSPHSNPPTARVRSFRKTPTVDVLIAVIRCDHLHDIRSLPPVCHWSGQRRSV